MVNGGHMKKLSFLLIALTLAAFGTQAWAGCFPSFPSFGRWQDGCGEWWNNSSLTFYAPFDNPADPLRLINGTGTLSFTRATTATYVHPTTGLITSAASGQLRIESNGALIEGQRANLVLQSSAFGTTWDNTNVTVDTDNTTSPDGTVNAELLTAFDANGTVIQDLGVIASAAKVFSVYLKRATGTGNIDLTLNGGTGWTTVAVTSSWARYQITATLADPDVGIRIVTSGDAVYAYGGQVEAATFASSLIPTTTAAVTRNADVLTFPTSGNVNGTVGTFSSTVQLESAFTDQSVLDLNNARFVLYRKNSSAAFTVADGTNTTAGSSWNNTASHKAAVRWSGIAVGVVADGGTITNGTFDGDFNAGTNASIGSANAGGYYPLYGWVKHFRTWSRAFTDAELQTISTP
jgi:hypothetical protein